MQTVTTKIRVHCPLPKCGHAYSVSVADLAKSLFCKRCEKKFRLPKIEHYLVLEELGRGAFGVVNRVYDLAENREAAVKLLNTDSLPPDRYDEWIERARNEAQVIANIVHPNILPLYRSGTHEGKFYMVTPLLPGKPLNDAIPEAGYEDPLEAVEIVITVLRTLHFVHAMKICHRDIKPGNIMVGDGGKIVYLMDFGLAVFHEKDTSRFTEYGTILGTIAYMPMEQAKGEIDRMGAWSDQYSAGVVLYKLLTGRLPYTGGTQAMLGDITDPDKPPTPLRKYRPGIDPDLERLVLRSLGKYPGQRYSSCESFAQQLREWVDEQKSRLREPRQPLPQPETFPLAIPVDRQAAEPPETESGGWLWIAILLLLLAGLGVGGYFAWQIFQDGKKAPTTKSPAGELPPDLTK